MNKPEAQEALDTIDRETLAGVRKTVDSTGDTAAILLAGIFRVLLVFVRFYVRWSE